MKEKQLTLLCKIKKMGIPILSSDLFHQAMDQRHHFNSTVALHSLHVAVICATVADVMPGLDTESLIIASLSHDLGILGRKEKYHHGYECIFRHPLESAVIMRELVPNVDQKTIDIVESHMFPLSLRMPKSAEAWVFVLADKIAALSDVFVAGEITRMYQQMQLVVS